VEKTLGKGGGDSLQVGKGKNTPGVLEKKKENQNAQHSRFFIGVAMPLKVNYKRDEKKKKSPG